MDEPKPTVTEKQPTDINDSADIVGRMQLLMDLIPLIVQTDSSSWSHGRVRFAFCSLSSAYLPTQLAGALAERFCFDPHVVEHRDEQVT